MNWKLHLLLEKYLKQMGFQVKTTRSDQKTDMALTTRGKSARGCGLLLSLHSNATAHGLDEQVDYPVVYYPVSGAGKELAQALADTVAAVMGTRQPGRVATRKGSRGDYYGVLRGATAVGVTGLIVEHSFHTNTRATNWLLVDENLDRLARAEAETIRAFYQTEVCNVELKILKKGMKGATVKAMQTLLEAMGHSCGTCGADGSFGGATLKAVRACRKAANLPAGDTCDGDLWGYLLGGGQ